MPRWVIVTGDDTEVAESGTGVDWTFHDEEFEQLFETLLIEGVASDRKNYLPGDEKFDLLFWEELSDRGYTVEMEVPEEVTVMPKALLDKLPDEAKKIYEEVYETALDRYDGDEGKASAVAITAVKNAGYKKDEDSDNWVKVKKMEVVSMYFTKAAKDPESGEMRWAATVSKFEEDDQGDEVTPAFYKSAIQAVERGKRPSPVVCVSHIDKGKPDDSWVAGDTEKMYIDGELPKAKGTFRDTPLGRALFESVKADMKSNLPTEERARISMGFFDEGSDPKEGGGRRFVKGWVKHLAATRVPVVKEAVMVIEKAEPTTVVEDAASIIGEEMAKKLLGEPGEVEKGLIVKAKREDQMKGLLEQLLALLGTADEDVDVVDDNRQAAGNRGTNPPRAEPVKSEVPSVDKVVDAFAIQVKIALKSSSDRADKFEAIQASLNAFGEDVTELVKGTTQPSSRDIGDVVAAAVAKVVRPLEQQVAELKVELDGVKGGDPAQPSQPRSMDQRVVMAQPPIPPTGSLTQGPPEQRKSLSASEVAWASTAEPVQARY